MNDSKTYRSIASLDVHERNNLSKFIRSPYFNSNEAVTHLFDLFDAHMRGKLNELDKETVWDSIYSKHAYNDAKLRKLNNDLLKLFEKYITIEHVQKDDKSYLSHQLKAVSDRNLELLYNGIKTKLDRINKITIDKSADHYYYLYDTEKTKFELKTDIQRKSKKANFAQEFNVNEISRNLDIFYLSEKLKYICTTLSWSRIYKIDIEPFDISPFEKFIFERKEIVPPIAIYYQIYLTLTDPDEIKHFLFLRKLINNYIETFPLKEQRYIYDSAVSYGVGMVNRGKLELQRPTLELYQTALKSEGFYENGYLSPTSYRNIVFFALRTKEFDWAEFFVKHYQHRLKEEQRSNAVAFNLARIEFYRKDYSEVISLLSSVEYNDLYYALNSRILLMASYYELEEFDPLESLINSTQAYLRREKKLFGSRKANFKNYVGFVRKLYMLPPNDRKKILNLKEKIVSTSAVASKPWLLEKIEELL